MKLVNFTGLLACIALTACLGFGKKCDQNCDQSAAAATEQTADAAAEPAAEGETPAK